MIVNDWCMYCGECSGVCPLNVIEVKETSVIIYDECNECGICVRACPVNAIEE